MNPTKTLHLLVPTLLSNAMLNMSLYEDVNKDLAVLGRLLFKADKVEYPSLGFHQELFSFFGYTADLNKSLPVAAYAMNPVFADEGFYLIAEPVHLRADQTTLRLFDQRLLDMDEAEWDDLYKVCKDFFSEQGWVLSQGKESRWYLHPQSHTDIMTTPIGEVMGQNIDPMLPSGKDAMHWHRLMNELQMLLHTHPVNLAREQQGKPMVNSLWFWGEGSIKSTVQSDLSHVWGGMSEVQGLSREAGLVHAPLADFDTQLRSLRIEPGQHLLILDMLMRHQAYQDVEDWYQGLLKLINDYFEPILKLLRAGEIDEVFIYPVNGARYRLRPRHLRYFWRRVQSLQDLS